MEAQRSFLTWQLLSRLHPAVPDDLIEASERALDLVRAGHTDALIQLESGFAVTAWDLVELLELGDLIDTF